MEPAGMPPDEDGEASVTMSVFMNDDDQSVAVEDNRERRKLLKAITEPIIPKDIWDSLSGREFQNHPDTVDEFAATGYDIASGDNSNEWIEWTKQKSHHGHGGHSGGSDDKDRRSRRRHHDKREGSNDEDDDDASVLEDDGILVWTGKSKRDGYGSKAPWIKTRAVVPLSPEEMADLLLDSSRVKSYNSWSMGRKDMWERKLPAGGNEGDGSVRGGGGGGVITSGPAPSTPSCSRTKIVKNMTQPPLGTKPMVAVTMLHARQITATNNNGDDPPAWLVVSRAVGGSMYRDEEGGSEEESHESKGRNNKSKKGSSSSKTTRSDIMLGVNYMTPRQDGKSSVLTSVTHVYSSSVPAILAERLGVKSAVKFVRDMRALKTTSAKVKSNKKTKVPS